MKKLKAKRVNDEEKMSVVVSGRDYQGKLHTIGLDISKKDVRSLGSILKKNSIPYEIDLPF